MMNDPNFTILYVDDPTKSAAFYASLLDKQPVEASPGFAMFALANGALLGLWKRDEVEPAATLKGGGAEMCFTVADQNEVLRVHDEWSKRGLPIAQKPVQMDFGHTFVALDPDGHRLRVFCR